MKKISFTVIAILLAIACGCNESVQPLGQSARPPHVAAMSSVRAALTASTWIHYLEVWNTLTKDQKYAVWIEKMDETIELPGWSQAQRNKLLEKKAKLSPAIYDAPMSEDEEFAMMEDLLQVFEPEQIERIFGHVYPYGHDIVHGPIVGPADPDCTCLWSIYCGVLSTCDRTGCTITQYGCGFWGSSQCKGRCDTPNGQ